MKVGLFITATGNYHQFLNRLLESADKYFLPDTDVSYLINSDNVDKVRIFKDFTTRQIIHRHINHEPWPNPTLKRFEYMDRMVTILGDRDDVAPFTHFFYIDADAWFASKITEEDITGTILNPFKMVGVAHCGYIFDKNKPFEHRTDNLFYVPEPQRKIYVGGGFMGGEAAYFRVMVTLLRNMIAESIETKKIPVWHDESAWNWFVSVGDKFATVVILSPAYHYPERVPGHAENIFKSWVENDDYNPDPKIILAYKGPDFKRL